jgi:hypothetical protein
MYSTRTGLILGFHGCDQSILQDILTGKKTLKPSTNEYDWLGHGIYFWDNSPSRALEYATLLKNHPGRAKRPIKKPAVIGAVINLGFCLDLLDYENLQFVKGAYEILVAINNTAGAPIPENRPPGAARDLLLRELDCAVIQTLHLIREKSGQKPFDSIRGVFWEGRELYHNAGFREKDHIQLCICNPNCIKGYFLPRLEDERYPKV